MLFGKENYATIPYSIQRLIISTLCITGGWCP